MVKISEQRIRSRAAADCVEVTHKDGTKETAYANGYKFKKTQSKGKKK